MKLINLTPHQLNFYNAENHLCYTLPKNEELPIVRVQKQNHPVGELLVEGVPLPLAETAFGEIENLPAPQPDVLYIVSTLVLQAIKERYPDRQDFLALDDFVRDPGGNILGCRTLTRLK